MSIHLSKRNAGIALIVLGALACVTAWSIGSKTAPATQEPAAEHPSYRYEDAFIRETPARISAGYVVIHNDTDRDDALIGVEAAAPKGQEPHQEPWAKRFEMHSIQADSAGIMTMKQVDTIPVPAHGTAALRPGGYHLMVYDLTQPLATGDTQNITLIYQSGRRNTVSFNVKPITYTGSPITAPVANHAVAPTTPATNSHHH